MILILLLWAAGCIPGFLLYLIAERLGHGGETAAFIAGGLGQLFGFVAVGYMGIKDERGSR